VTTHVITIEPSGHSRHVVSHQGEVLGTFKEPLCGSARHLLAAGKAVRSDRLMMARVAHDGRLLPAMSGSVGWLADHTVMETDKVSPRWAKHRPLDHAFPRARPAADSLLELAAPCIASN
jgi:hypothetical protein